MTLKGAQRQSSAHLKNLLFLKSSTNVCGVKIVKNLLYLYIVIQNHG